METHERITSSPAVRNGKPCIRGTRIAVKDVVEYVAGGMPESELLADFPSLTEADVRAALDFDRRTTSDERERS